MIENLFHGDAEYGSKCEPIHDTLASGCISVGDNYNKQADEIHAGYIVIDQQNSSNTNNATK